MLASVAWFGAVLVWDIASGALQHSLEAHENWPTKVVLAPGGNILGLAAPGDTIELHDVKTGVLQHTLVGHNSHITAITFASDRVLASSSADGEIRLWNTATGVVQQTFHTNEGYVEQIALAPNGLLASASEVWNDTVQLWDITTKSLEQTQTQRFRGHLSRVEQVTFAPGGGILASTSYDDTLRLWDVATGTLKQTLDVDYYSFTMSFAPGGDLLAITDWNTVQLWVIATGLLRQTLKGHTGPVTRIVFGNGVLASASEDGTVRLWNLSTGEPQHTLKGHGEGVQAIAFAPGDVNMIASASNDQSVRVWNVATGELQQTLCARWDLIEQVAFAGELVLAAACVGFSKLCRVHMWDLATGALLRSVDTGGPGRDSIFAMGSSNSSMFATWARGPIRLWDVATGALQGEIDVATTSMHFSSDGAMLMTDSGQYAIGETAGEQQDQSFAEPVPVGLHLRDEWIQFQGEDILWLPHDFRGQCSTAFGSTLAVGQPSGAVSFFRLKSTSESSKSKGKHKSQEEIDAAPLKSKKRIRQC
jgi:WD40 repeat protein